MDNIVILHGTPISIVSNSYAKFTSIVWKEFQEEIGIELKFNLIVKDHPNTRGFA